MARPAQLTPVTTAALAPLVREHLHDMLMTTEEVAARWRQSPTTLQNQRNQMTGIPYMTLGGGWVRYKLSDVIASEIAGYTGAHGPRVANAIETFPGLDAQTKTALLKHLKACARP